MANDAQVTPDAPVPAHLVKLRAYMQRLPHGGKGRLAKALGVSCSYLSRMASGEKPITPERALAIELATAGAVSRTDTRPHDWFRLWPELVGTGGNLKERSMAA